MRKFLAKIDVQVPEGPLQNHPSLDMYFVSTRFWLNQVERFLGFRHRGSAVQRPITAVYWRWSLTTMV